MRWDQTSRCLVPLVLAWILVLSGCHGGNALPPVNEQQSGEQTGGPITGEAVGFQPVEVGFDASYSEPVLKLPAAYTDPRMELPIDLGLIQNVDLQDFSEAQLSMLENNGFFIDPDSNYREFDGFYEDVFKQSMPAYITSDSLLHAYHLMFVKLLRQMEEQQFYPKLSELTVALSAAAGDLASELKGTSLKTQALHVWAYFAVAEQLLLAEPPPVAEPIREMVEAELEEIDAHSGLHASPVMSIDTEYQEDYSQYAPRGHYTRSALRRRYFKTMIWYGRLNLRLKSLRETQAALLITYLVQATPVGETTAADCWAAVYDPTSFLIGNADDLSVRDYSALAGEVCGGNVDLEQISDEQLLAKFIRAAWDLPAPQINSMLVFDTENERYETQGFRFMGQRFVLDSFLLNRLVHKYVTYRWLPSGLDVFASFGNSEALAILDERGDTSLAHYSDQQQMLQEYVTGYSPADWTSTVYNGWLYSLDGLTVAKDEQYPPFMRTRAWARRELSGALGSWAELRHDTILYAKQSYGFPVRETPPPPPSFVEPNPLLFARLAGLAELTGAGLAGRQLADEETGALLTDLKDMLAQCQTAAEAELAGEQIPAETADALYQYNMWLVDIVLRTMDRPNGEVNGIDEPAALIADVATDPQNSEVLEVGTGRIDRLYVAIPAGDDALNLSLGGVFSYYEFAWPMNDRLTDEAWREQLETGTQPPRPAWTKLFIPE